MVLMHTEKFCAMHSNYMWKTYKDHPMYIVEMGPESLTIIFYSKNWVTFATTWKSSITRLEENQNVTRLDVATQKFSTKYVRRLACRLSYLNGFNFSLQISIDEFTQFIKKCRIQLNDKRGSFSSQIQRAK